MAEAEVNEILRIGSVDASGFTRTEVASLTFSGIERKDGMRYLFLHERVGRVNNVSYQS